MLHRTPKGPGGPYDGSPRVPPGPLYPAAQLAVEIVWALWHLPGHAVAPAAVSPAVPAAAISRVHPLPGPRVIPVALVGAPVGSAVSRGIIIPLAVLQSSAAAACLHWHARAANARTRAR